MANIRSSTTEIKSYKGEYIWNLKNFHLYSNGDSLTSTKYSMENDGCVIQWYFKIHDVYNSTLWKNERMFTISFPISTSSIKILCHADLHNGRDIIATARSAHPIRPIYDQDYRNMSVIRLPINPLDGKSSIHCESNALTYVHVLLEFVKVDAVSTVDNKLPITMSKIQTRNVSNDIKTLFETKEFADIIFVVKGQKFPAHKVILSARSPVFSAMFKTPMRERTQDQIDIKDVEPKIFDEMLRFIYTDEIVNIEKIATDLLAAADRFEISELITACTIALFSTISVENAVEAFVFADRHNVEELAIHVMNFVTTHRAEVVATSGFKSMAKLHPQLTIQLLSGILEKSSTK